jgi:uroporphyrinogen decarboxylase
MNSFLQVLNGKKPKEVPVWLMRQAGRFLPEYRELRASVPTFWDAVFTPEIAAEITLQPLRRFPEIDAAILFSDILVIPHALGQEVTFIKGEGPSLAAIGILEYQPEKLEPIIQTIRLIKKDASAAIGGKAVIGFAGGAWTVACYMVSGRNDGFGKTIKTAKKNPEEFARVIDAVTDATIDYLSRQVAAGVDAIQIFESWAHLLADDTEQFDKWIIQPTKKIAVALKAKYPAIKIIGFPREGRDQIIPYVQKTGVDAVGLDQHADLKWVNDNLPPNFPVQGNLAPELLVQGGEAMKAEAKRILLALENRPHIFNLGHGVLPETPFENAAVLFKIVKENK